MSDYAIGVDLGGTNLRVATIHKSGEIMERLSVPAKVHEGPGNLLGRIGATVNQAIDQLKTKGQEPVGVGIGVPGIIQMDRGFVEDAPNLGWKNLPVRKHLEKILKCTVILENDANAAALGEKWMGSGQGTNHLCLLTLGTGVGGGFIMNGKIWHGFRGMAGEVGHVNIYPDGVACNCNGQGCLEQYASAQAIVREGEKAARKGLSPKLRHELGRSGKLTAKTVGHQARQGDNVAQAIYADAGKALGIALGTIMSLLELPLYLLNGGVAAAWDLFAPAMFAQLEKGAYMYRTGGIRVESGKLKEDAGLFGAAYLPFCK